MAQRTVVQLTDDLDGTEIRDGKGETLSFALDRQGYEIDLTDKNAKAMREAFQKYISAARRASGGDRARRRARGGQREQRPGAGLRPEGSTGMGVVPGHRGQPARPRAGGSGGEVPAGQGLTARPALRRRRG